VVGCNYRGMPPSGAPVRNLLGANMSFRREVFGLVDGFQTGIGRTANKRPLGGEETVFCIRLSQRSPGSLLVMEHRAKVWHFVSDSRCRFSYFLSRCDAEGISKAQVTASVGRGDGLSGWNAPIPRGSSRSAWPGASHDPVPRRSGGPWPCRGDHHRAWRDHGRVPQGKARSETPMNGQSGHKRGGSSIAGRPWRCRGHRRRPARASGFGHRTAPRGGQPRSGAQAGSGAQGGSRDRHAADFLEAGLQFKLFGDQAEYPRLATCYPWAKNGCTNFGNGGQEKEWYTASQDTVKNGFLNLIAQREPTAGVNAKGAPQEYACRSGMVTTFPGFRFKYGYLQITAHIPFKTGLLAGVLARGGQREVAAGDRPHGALGRSGKCQGVPAPPERDKAGRRDLDARPIKWLAHLHALLDQDPPHLVLRRPPGYDDNDGHPAAGHVPHCQPSLLRLNPRHLLRHSADQVGQGLAAEELTTTKRPLGDGPCGYP